MLACFVAVGCGKVGKHYQPTIAFIFYDLSDAKAGGPAHRESDLFHNGKGTYVDHAEMEVLEDEGNWCKVKLLYGKDKGAIGWISANQLGEPI